MSVERPAGAGPAPSNPGGPEGLADPPAPARRFPTLNLILLLATFATVWFVAAGAAPEGSSLAELALYGLPQTAALMAILLVHEAAHYLASRHHRVNASLPYFIPVPFPPLGTLGAFIRIRSPLPTRTAVLDIGASGPIAGFLVALPLLFWGFSEATPIYLGPAHPNAIWQSPFSALSAWLSGDPMAFYAEGVPILGDSVITWLAARLTYGPLPPLTDLQIGPIGFAAWIGMFVTTLNLIPVGQLDGGHVLRALLGPRARRAARLASWVLLGLGLFASWTWLVWWALIRFGIGLDHPPPTTDEPLSKARRAVGVVALLILALTFVPVPFRF